jgi:hypothetical protein
MFDVSFDDNVFSVRFYYEPPTVYNGKSESYHNTHCAILLKGQTKDSNRVITSGNCEVPFSRNNHAATRKIALTKALTRGSVGVVDGKEVPVPFFTREERTAIWRKYFSLLSKKNPEHKIAAIQATPAEPTVE